MNRYLSDSNVLVKDASVGETGRRKFFLHTEFALFGLYKKKLLSAGLASAIAVVSWNAFAAEQESPAAAMQGENELFAVVNGEKIARSTYETVLHMGARNRFYHGKAPEEELQLYRKEVADSLIAHALLHQEALKRGIKPDELRVDEAINKAVKRYNGNPDWEKNKESSLAVLREGLERRDRVRRLEDLLRAEVTEPTEQQLQEYYRSNPETFTSPPQTRVAMILLKVPAWANTEQWDQTREKADAIHLEISNGLEFAEAVKLYSDDESAQQDGDLGYLHKGMLSPQAEEAIKNLEVGQYTKSVTLLEGVALFNLKDSRPARLNSFEQVRDRALSLWLREKREKAVDVAIENLRQDADISYFAPQSVQLRHGHEGRNGAPVS